MMRNTVLQRVLLVLLLLILNTSIRASEVDQLRQRAKVLHRAAAVLGEQGRGELGAKLKARSAELREAAERLDAQGIHADEPKKHAVADLELAEIADRLQDLIAHEHKLRDSGGPAEEIAEVQQQIRKFEQALQHITSPEAASPEIPPAFRPAAEKLAEASRRAHHLHVAAQNLKMAEMHDLAHEVIAKAEALEREAQAGKMRLAAEMRHAHAEQTDVNQDQLERERDLKVEVERLRAEIQELHRRLESE